MILYALDIAKKIKDKSKKEIEKKKLKILLSVILIGDNYASKVYIKNKKIACDYVGIDFKLFKLDENISQEKLLNLINNLNLDDKITGILVQLPLPDHIDKTIIMQNIDPKKDVDGFNPFNIGALILEKPKLIPCTALGILELIKFYNIKISGTYCAVLGRSIDVGKPVAALMLNANSTVAVCHSKTENLIEITRKSDIIISSIGKAKFIKKDFIKRNSVLIDVGINRDENNKLCGDIDFDSCIEKAHSISPVPKGVGAMTIAMLINNCIKAKLIQLNIIE
ncbi:MAG: bifunctional 5,10-methylenetetrahydrofolate dehydrogenase/5,10-methenyltetrahydrofolate cyclohydrolase [Clostridiales bacterium]|nr:bifunctional 5,10-methylenetetrahydrofolate dehydrogenase/5,10-methenyltetrahydrofolate cyclohydrolase [Clostridiales bacterium]